jgi:hypothetical protein
MLIRLLPALLLCTCLVSAEAEKSNFTFSATYGVHPVGFSRCAAVRLHAFLSSRGCGR